MIPISDENPIRITPFVTWALAALCVLAYAWEVSLGDVAADALDSYGFTPATLFHNGTGWRAMLAALSARQGAGGAPVWASLLLYPFLHAGLLHLGANLLYLWIFANNIEDAMGHVRFILFYVLCGIGAAFTMALAAPASAVPMVGASGAISGVLGAYMLLYPRARVRVILPLGFIFLPFRVRALWVVGLWFATQLLSAAVTPPDTPGTAWWAHVGGFAAGLVLTPLLKSALVPYFGPPAPFEAARNIWKRR